MQNDLWGDTLLLCLLCLLRPQNCIVQTLLHSFRADTVLLHVLSEFLSLCLHQVHDLIVDVHVSRRVRGVVVIVRLKVSLIDVVGHVPCPGGQILNVVSLLQCRVPHQAR